MRAHPRLSQGIASGFCFMRISVLRKSLVAHKPYAQVYAYALQASRRILSRNLSAIDPRSATDQVGLLAGVSGLAKVSKNLYNNPARICECLEAHV